jgi:hypothetical protein
LHKQFSKIIILLFIASLFSCSKKQDQSSDRETGGKDFLWKPELRISDIPDFPVKGFINGREIKIDYVNFEQWRGSGDNVINFGDVKPVNNCGYVENSNSFHIMHKGGIIGKGELLKSSFEQNLDEYVSFIEVSGVKDENKKSIPWNCALVITEIGEKTVKGKIAMCYKDDKLSWIAGTFEATRCNN